MPEQQLFLSPGERANIELPFSEVCMHLGIAGRNLPVELLENGMAQVYDGNDKKISFPILASEAGFYFDIRVGGWYCYGTYAQNAPAECAIDGCRNSVCECGSDKCHFHTHELPPVSGELSEIDLGELTDERDYAEEEYWRHFRDE